MYRNEPSDRDHDIYDAITLEFRSEKEVCAQYQISAARLRAIVGKVQDWIVATAPFEEATPREAAIRALKVRLSSLREYHAAAKEQVELIRVWKNKEFWSVRSPAKKRHAKGGAEPPNGVALMTYNYAQSTAKIAEMKVKMGLISPRANKGKYKVTKTRLKEDERWLRLADELGEKIAKVELALLKLRFGSEETEALE